jgi:hypothetical protein
MREDDLIAMVVFLVVGAVALTIYVGLILLGISIAKRKNRSPHWMWFAIHPIGLLVTLIVMASLSPLKVCPNCMQRSAVTARLCGFCGYDFNGHAFAQQPAGVYLPPPVY